MADICIPEGRLLNASIDIAPAELDAHYGIARTLFTEYATSLGVDLSFQRFEAELGSLQSMYAPPGGILLLAWRNAEAVGCIGVRALSRGDCEMKRLYVRPAARGLGLGHCLAGQAIRWATDRGYGRMCLDTLASMDAARALYRELGFEVIAPYYDNPIAGTTFMALTLNHQPSG